MDDDGVFIPEIWVHLHQASHVPASEETCTNTVPSPSALCVFDDEVPLKESHQSISVPLMRPPLQPEPLR